MKTPEEFNKDYQDERKESRRAGVKCPKCGEEMYYPPGATVVTTCPPKRPVTCDCGYSTSIYC
jgi:uncharacterized OB-fold protein